VEDLRLRFPGSDIAELPLGTGVHAIGRTGPAQGDVGRVADPDGALASFCVDRRGVWLTVPDAVRGVHVNGRPVRRMAMLRVGDTVHVDGIEIVLVARSPVTRMSALPPGGADAPADPRIVLRGVGGRHHGRSFTLERPRLVGRAVDADVRIDDPAFPERHARLELHDEGVLLRDLGSGEGSVVNGEPVRDAVLRPGDQVVFDAHHRFVVEAPSRTALRADAPPLPEDDGLELIGDPRQGLSHATRRLPWLLLAALLIAAALSALLLLGSTR